MAEPTRRLAVVTGASVLALVVTTLIGGSGAGSSEPPPWFMPAGVEVDQKQVACSGRVREVVIRGLGSPIQVQLKGVPHRSLVRTQSPSGDRSRDRWQLRYLDRCPPPPCEIPQAGLNAYDPRSCADG